MKRLALVAAECAARGQIKTGAQSVLIKTIADDLAGVDEDFALKAIQAYRRKSPFFPHISDLWPEIERLKEERLETIRAEAERRAERAAIQAQIEARNAPHPGGTVEERRAHVKRMREMMRLAK